VTPAAARPAAGARGGGRRLRRWRHLVLSSLLLCGAGIAGSGASDGEPKSGKLYRVVDGKADLPTYNGFRRYHAGCNHCHGPDGVGSTFAPSLIDSLPDIDAFRQIVREGRARGDSVMKGFAGDPNVAPYIDDIYAYLQARADGVLGRGRPARIDE
jgi:mono/diheme cytochrome c family protein